MAKKKTTPPTRLQSVMQWLFYPVDAASLVMFRIAFGALMMWEVYRYVDLGRVFRYYIDPGFTFTYWGFDWIQPWPGDGMYIHFYVMAALACCMMLGWRYRITSPLFYLAFTYVMLLDKAKFLNHFYLISLISLIMAVIPAEVNYSLDARRNPSLRSSTVPRWSVALLQFQIGVAYLYGGIAKINWDWLYGMPMHLWLPNKTDVIFIGQFVHEWWMPWLFTYAGLFIDLFIVPFLLWRRTRVAAYVMAVLFNLVNSQIFSIGIFPWFMIVATTIYFEPDWPKRAIEFLFEGKKIFETATKRAIKKFSRSQYITASLLGVFLAWQILFPFRHFLYPDNVSWTEEAHRFAWHMKLRSKTGKANFTVMDNETYETYDIDLEDYLTDRQIRKMSIRPDMVIQFAHYIADVFEERGVNKPIVYADVKARLNGRPYQQLVDPTVNLAARERNPWKHADWIVPLTTPLPKIEYE